MDVRTRFAISMVVLGVIIVILGIFVYISATRNPFQEDALSPITPTPLPSEETFGVDGVNTLFNQGDGSQQAEDDEPKVIATITLDDTTTPGDEQKTKNSDEKSNEVIYTVRMNTSWSKTLHPDWYPEGAHFSPMVVWSHRLKNTLFEIGSTASDGVEVMAETGGTAEISREIQQMIDGGYIFKYATGKKIDVPGTDTVEITISKAAPYATVVSMLAPSPDWFVAVENVLLFEDGQWVEQKTIPSIIYDAGTDSGTTFTARNRDTNPAEPIELFSEQPTIPIATFEFTKN